MSARVAWCHLVDVRRIAPGSSQNVYNVGLDFTDSLGQAPEIFNFIEGHIVIELDRRLSGRFRLRADDSRPELRSDFDVKRISFGGMAIEVEHSPPRDALLEVEALGRDPADRLSGPGRFVGDARSPRSQPQRSLSIRGGTALSGPNDRRLPGARRLHQTGDRVTHSARKARIGSIRPARRAGRYPAASEATAISSAAPVNVRGSVASTP